MHKKIITAFMIVIILFFKINPIIYASNSNGSVRYQVHLQDRGWVNTVYDGNVAGTTGEARRMEAIAIAISGIDGSLSYKVHVQDYGWLGSVKEGIIAGTTGQSKRMEAIIINLDNSSYNIKYRVHVQDYGWMNWVTNGQVAGTTGQSRRIEAIQIALEKKNKQEAVNNAQSSNRNTNTNNEYSGIDVSKHQGNIDWKKVKNAGINFAMIRGGYRGYTEGYINEDIKFKDNVKNAYENGIKVGIYFYSSAVNEIEAREEAEFILNLINKYNIKSYITYPIAIDIEDFEDTRNYSLSIQQRTNIVKTFCEVIKNNGLKPMVYSYTYFLETKLDMDKLTNYDTWIADYYGNTWYKRKYTIWQYSDKGNIDGIEGDVDLNYSYCNY